jgi:hypothetical protein
VNALFPTHRARSRSGACAVLVATLCAVLALAPAAPGAVQARPADSFVESVGVNVHLGYTGSAYYRIEKVRAALAELGARYIRDGVGLDRPDVYARMRALAADGVRVNLIVGDPQRRWGIGTLAQQLEMIDRELRPAAASLEAPNEYDNQGDPRWAAALGDYQRRLWAGANARPGLARLPVIGPSLVSGESHDQLGALGRWMDEGNIHPYPGGDPPDRDSHLEEELEMAAKVAGDRPVQATESGYHNSLGETGHLPASERAAGVYMPRLFLDYFRRGIRRTFAYELIDAAGDRDRSEDSRFGLLRSDFSEKPAFTAMKRLIALLADRGPAFRPGSLGFSLRGALPSTRWLLLQKRDGVFYLVLWNQASVWSPRRRVDLDPPDRRVTLALEQPIARADLYRPNDSAVPVRTARGLTELTLPVSEEITVVRLVRRLRRPGYSRR